MKAPNARLEVAGIDSVILRLFDFIDEANMPWMLAARTRLREVFGGALIDLVPSYTTLLLHYDLCQLDSEQARAKVAEALAGLQPADLQGGREHQLPTWYDRSVGPELQLLARRSGLSEAEVIARHSSHAYQVFALGFAPASPSWAWSRKSRRAAPEHAAQAHRRRQRRHRRTTDGRLPGGFARRLEPDRAHAEPPVRQRYRRLQPAATR